MLLLYFTQGATKVSATLFFKRLFVSPRFHLAANIMLAAVIGWTISLFIVSVVAFGLFSNTDASRSKRFVHGRSLDSGTRNY